MTDDMHNMTSYMIYMRNIAAAQLVMVTILMVLVLLSLCASFCRNNKCNIEHRPKDQARLLYLRK